MKLSTILCGAAAVALLATSAQAGGSWGHGGGHGGGGHGGGHDGGGNGGSEGWGQYATPNNSGGASHTNHHNWTEAANGNASVSRWAAKYEGKSNIGNAGTSDGATFTLRGNVSPHCVFYTGSESNLNFNFGQIGIYASENHGPALAFDQVAGAKLMFRTNLAGCNTKNKVTLSRPSSALKNTPAFGYDSAQFTAEIPFSVKAAYTAGSAAAGQNTASPKTLSLTNSNSASDTHGAWKSPMEITVSLDQASKSLVAGDYTGSFSIQIQAL